MADCINLRAGIIYAIDNAVWEFLKMENAHSLLEFTAKFLIPDQEISDPFKLKEEGQRNLYTCLPHVILSSLAQFFCRVRMKPITHDMRARI